MVKTHHGGKGVLLYTVWLAGLAISAMGTVAGDFCRDRWVISPDSVLKPSKTTTGWWFQPTPLKNDGVRQLG